MSRASGSGGAGSGEPGSGGAGRAWGLVAVAVLGISTSAPLSAAMAAPVLAVAFWRNLVGALASGGWAGLRERAGVAALWRDRQLTGLALLAGVLLAGHFTSWLAGLRLTSVTASTALVCTTPVWTVALDLIRRVAVPARVLGGVLLAMIGVLAITGVDAGRSGSAALGDLLSLAGAIAMAGYVALGNRVMRSASTAVYTTFAYTTCALVLLPVCLLTGTQLAGFSTRTWLELATVTVGAQLLGHTLLNAALPRVGVTPLALAILLEVPGASLVAWVWLGQAPPLSVLPGAALMLLGLGVVVSATPRAAGLPDAGGAVRSSA
jgi:drug/metabolite transporter (DMT)-like permease